MIPVFCTMSILCCDIGCALGVVDFSRFLLILVRSFASVLILDLFLSTCVRLYFQKETILQLSCLSYHLVKKETVHIPN